MISRRNLLGAGATAFTIAKPWMVRAAGKEKLRAGVVGCGGRGTQAVVDLLTGTENVELVAMADVFEDHLEGSLKRLRDPKFNSRHAGIVVERDGKPHEMTKDELSAEMSKRITIGKNCVLNRFSRCCVWRLFSTSGGSSVPIGL